MRRSCNIAFSPFMFGSHFKWNFEIFMAKVRNQRQWISQNRPKMCFSQISMEIDHWNSLYITNLKFDESKIKSEEHVTGIRVWVLVIALIAIYSSRCIWNYFDRISYLLPSVLLIHIHMELVEFVGIRFHVAEVWKYAMPRWVHPNGQNAFVSHRTRLRWGDADWITVNVQFQVGFVCNKLHICAIIFCTFNNLSSLNSEDLKEK